MTASISGPMSRGIARARRKTVTTAPEHMVRESSLPTGGRLPLVIEPAIANVDLAAWAAANQARMEERLRIHGGILFRGFAIEDLDAFRSVMDACAGSDLIEYRYRSTPRSQLRDRVYTSTEYPAEESIPMHNEMSYARSWPRLIWFCSVQVATEGGETPIADSREVYRRIPTHIRDRFVDKGVMYLRNYGGGMDLSWQNVFQSEDRSEVEAFCRAHGIEAEWRGDDRLRTRQICQAVTRHPQTGDSVWFNQAHLFHVSSLPPAAQTSLASLAPDELPRTACYGDGSAIEDEALEVIRRVYDETSVAFLWQQGDVLMLDNILTAHGRRPFAGKRQVLVGMADPVDADAVN